MNSVKQKSCVFCVLLLCAMNSTSTQADTSTENSKLASYVEKMFAGGNKSAERIKSDTAFKNAKKLASEDPRVDFARGLVLMKRLKQTDALEEFKLAAESAQLGQSGQSRKLGESTAGAKGVFLPAWQARIWLLTLRRKQPDALKLIPKLASLAVAEVEVVQARNETFQTAVEDAKKTANWIGQYLAAIRVLNEKKTVEPLEVATKEVTAILERCKEPGLRKAFATGEQELMEKFAAVSEAADRKVQTRDQKQNKRADEMLTKAQEGLKTTEEEKEDLKLANKDAKAKLVESLGETSRELGRLETEFSAVKEQVLKLQQTMERAQLERNRQITLESIAGRSTQLQKLARERDFTEGMLKQQQKLKTLTATAQQVSRAAELQVAKRIAATKLYEKVTGEVARRDKSLDRWQRRLKDKKSSASIKKSTTRSGRNSGRVKFRMLIDFDRESEQQKLLDELNGVAKALPEKKAIQVEQQLYDN